MVNTFIDKLWENKDNLELIKDEDFIINWEKAMEYQMELNSLNEYIPVLLKPLLDSNYISRQNDDVTEQFSKAYWIHKVADSDVLWEFLRKDCLAWIQEHPQFEDIIIKAKT